MPLPPVEIVLRDGGTGEEIARKTTEKAPGSGIGRAHFYVIVRETFIVELANVPPDVELCPNSPRQRVIHVDDFVLGQISVKFFFWWGCPPG